MWCSDVSDNKMNEAFMFGLKVWPHSEQTIHGSSCGATKTKERYLLHVCHRGGTNKWTKRPCVSSRSDKQHERTVHAWSRGASNKWTKSQVVLSRCVNYERTVRCRVYGATKIWTNSPCVVLRCDTQMNDKSMHVLAVRHKNERLVYLRSHGTTKDDE